MAETGAQIEWVETTLREFFSRARAEDRADSDLRTKIRIAARKFKIKLDEKRLMALPAIKRRELKKIYSGLDTDVDLYEIITRPDGGTPDTISVQLRGMKNVRWGGNSNMDYDQFRAAVNEAVDIIRKEALEIKYDPHSPKGELDERVLVATPSVPTPETTRPTLTIVEVTHGREPLTKVIHLDNPMIPVFERGAGDAKASKKSAAPAKPAERKQTGPLFAVEEVDVDSEVLSPPHSVRYEAFMFSAYGWKVLDENQRRDLKNWFRIMPRLLLEFDYTPHSFDDVRMEAKALGLAGEVQLRISQYQSNPVSVEDLYWKRMALQMAAYGTGLVPMDDKLMLAGYEVRSKGALSRMVSSANGSSIYAARDYEDIDLLAKEGRVIADFRNALLKDRKELTFDKATGLPDRETDIDAFGNYLKWYLHSGEMYFYVLSTYPGGSYSKAVRSLVALHMYCKNLVAFGRNNSFWPTHINFDEMRSPVTKFTGGEDANAMTLRYKALASKVDLLMQFERATLASHFDVEEIVRVNVMQGWMKCELTDQEIQELRGFLQWLDGEIHCDQQGLTENQKSGLSARPHESFCKAIDPEYIEANYSDKIVEQRMHMRARQKSAGLMYWKRKIADDLVHSRVKEDVVDPEDMPDLSQVYREYLELRISQKEYDGMTVVDESRLRRWLVYNRFLIGQDALINTDPNSKARRMLLADKSRINKLLGETGLERELSEARVDPKAPQKTVQLKLPTKPIKGQKRLRLPGGATHLENSALQSKPPINRTISGPHISDMEDPPLDVEAANYTLFYGNPSTMVEAVTVRDKMYLPAWFDPIQFAKRIAWRQVDRLEAAKTYAREALYSLGKGMVHYVRSTEQTLYILGTLGQSTTYESLDDRITGAYVEGKTGNALTAVAAVDAGKALLAAVPGVDRVLRSDPVVLGIKERRLQEFSGDRINDLMRVRETGAARGGGGDAYTAEQIAEAERLRTMVARSQGIYMRYMAQLQLHPKLAVNVCSMAADFSQNPAVIEATETTKRCCELNSRSDVPDVYLPLFLASWANLIGNKSHMFVRTEDALLRDRFFRGLADLVVFDGPFDGEYEQFDGLLDKYFGAWRGVEFQQKYHVFKVDDATMTRMMSSDWFERCTLVQSDMEGVMRYFTASHVVPRKWYRDRRMPAMGTLAGFSFLRQELDNGASMPTVHSDGSESMKALLFDYFIESVLFDLNGRKYIPGRFCLHRFGRADRDDDFTYDFDAMNAITEYRSMHKGLTLLSDDEIEAAIVVTLTGMPNDNHGRLFMELHACAYMQFKCDFIKNNKSRLEASGLDIIHPPKVVQATYQRPIVVPGKKNSPVTHLKLPISSSLLFLMVNSKGVLEMQAPGFTHYAWA